MTVFAWPLSPAFKPETCSIYLRPNTREFTSQYSGSFQAVDLLGERFVMQARLPVVTRAASGAIEAYFNRLRGVHWVTAWHFARPQPVGTQRGAPALSVNVAQGASALPITNGTPGATFEPGDMLGLGAELFQVAEPITFNGAGVGTVQTVNRVRTATGLAAGTTVVWDRPTANWRLSSPVALNHVPGLVTDALDLELIQVW